MSVFNIDGFGKRFGIIPLPVEQASTASDGELMVSKTTGHIYIRNGERNVSKTVELEEFLKALRVGCINGVRNSGEFYTDLAKLDWYLQSNIDGKQEPTFEKDPETSKTIMTFTTTSKDSTCQYFANSIGLYNKLKYKKGDKICLSIIAKASKNINITVCVQNGDSTNRKLTFKTITLTSEYTKFEMPIVVNSDVVFDENSVLYFDLGNQSKGTKISIQCVQLEPGDRSSAWRPSWLDFYQRMDFMNSGLKEWVKERIVEAINQCKNYTDSSITSLSNNVKQWIQNALEQSKDYTNQEITKVNNKIDDTKKELLKRDTMQRVHLALGNQDLKHLFNNNQSVVYDNEKKGVIVNGPQSIWLELPIPITENSKYSIRIKGKQLVGDGQLYLGVDSLDDNFSSLNTDTATSYNYFFAGGIIHQNESFDTSTIYQGFNTPQEGDGAHKFDPNASYFKLVLLCNYQQPDSYKTLITDIEIFEIPYCLWNALSPSDSNNVRDGLLSANDKRKLDSVEWNANNYKHPTGDGNLHVPATSNNSNGKVLTAGSNPGELRWVTPSTNADTLDGMDSGEFMRRVNPPSSHDCNDFKELNAFCSWDTGYSEFLNTPLGTLAKSSAQVFVIKNYAHNNSRISQEFIFMYPKHITVRYIRSYSGDTDQNGGWGPWQKIYSTGDKPTPEEIGAVNKNGDTMTGDLRFSADGLGIEFAGGRLYKKIGSGMVLRTHDAAEIASVFKVESHDCSKDFMDVGDQHANFSGKLKSKNIDTGRFSLKYDSSEECLDFIFE